MVLISAGKTLSDRPSVYKEQGFQPTCVMNHIIALLTYAMTMSPSRSFVSYVSASRGESITAREKPGTPFGSLDSCLRPSEYGQICAGHLTLPWTVEEMLLWSLLVEHIR